MGKAFCAIRSGNYYLACCNLFISAPGQLHRKKSRKSLASPGTNRPCQTLICHYDFLPPLLWKIGLAKVIPWHLHHWRSSSEVCCGLFGKAYRFVSPDEAKLHSDNRTRHVWRRHSKVWRWTHRRESSSSVKERLVSDVCSTKNMKDKTQVVHFTPKRRLLFPVEEGLYM